MTILEPKTHGRSGATPNFPESANFTDAKPRSLAQAVQGAVRAFDGSKLRPVARHDAGLAFQPKVLLAVLSYCYARKIYATKDVKGIMERDGEFRQHCQNELPGTQIIRRFRSENREPVSLCLKEALRFEAEQKVKEGIVTRVSDTQLAEEARRRLITAMFTDSIKRDEE